MNIMITRQSLLGSDVPPGFDPRQDQARLIMIVSLRLDVVEKQNT